MHFLGYAKNHAPNVYQMLKLDTNTVIMKKRYDLDQECLVKCMGMTNMKRYNVQENGSDEKSNIELVKNNERKNDDGGEEPIRSNLRKRKRAPESPKCEQNRATKNTNLYLLAKNQQTFHNPTGRNDV